LELHRNASQSDGWTDVAEGFQMDGESGSVQPSDFITTKESRPTVSTAATF
jgi:hypothetical protein